MQCTFSGTLSNTEMCQSTLDSQNCRTLIYIYIGGGEERGEDISNWDLYFLQYFHESLHTVVDTLY